MGCDTILHDELSTIVGDQDLVINTVPSLVINSNLLGLMRSDVLIIDLASLPGGTDFQAAENLHIKAILAPGLPGKVAPKTAGAILATALPEILEKILAEGGGR
jgi:dipicolinate synthase subunit A